MSTNQVSVQRVVDPRLVLSTASGNPSGHPVFLTNSGALNNNVRTIPSNSSNNNSFLSFQCSPNNIKNVIDRVMILSNMMTVTITGNTGDVNVPLLYPNAFAINSLWRVIQSAEININGTSFVEQSSYLADLVPYFNDWFRNSFLSSSPMFARPDTCQNYNDVFDTLANPLSDFLNSDGPLLGRGAVTNLQIITNTSTQATFTFILNDFVTVSPITPTATFQQGLQNLSSLNMSFQLNNLGRLFSITNSPNSTLTISNLSVAISNSYLTFQELTVQEQFVSTVSRFNYKEPIVYVTSGVQSVVAGAAFTMVSNNLILNNIPSVAIIYSKQSQASINASFQSQMTTPNAFAAITSCSVQYDGLSNILSNATPQFLFDTAVRNGISMSYPQWSGRTLILGQTVGTSYNLPLTGSILPLSFAHDLCSMNSDGTSTAVGQEKNANFQVNINCVNTSNQTIQYEMVIVFLYDAIATIRPQFCEKTKTVFTTSALMDAKVVDDSELPAMGEGFMDRSKLFGKVKTGLHSLGKQSLQKLTPVLKDIAKDISKELLGGSVKDNMYCIDGFNGQGLVGGRHMSRGSLKSRYK
jgi:hypothetical protein